MPFLLGKCFCELNSTVEWTSAKQTIYFATDWHHLLGWVIEVKTYWRFNNLFYEWGTLYHVEEPAWPHTAVGWHPILNLCHKSASLEQMACPSRSHRISMELRSNYRQAISSSPLPCSWGKSLINLTLWGRVFSCWRMEFVSKIVDIWDNHWLQNLIL